MSDASTVVIGEGWSALASVAFLAQRGEAVRWVSGSGSRVLAPLPGLEVGPGVDVWGELCRRMGVDCGELLRGSFLREFRNKAFREPPWTKAPTPEMRRDVRDESLWSPECHFAAAFEARFELPLGEIEEELRKTLANLPNVERIHGIPVTEFRFGNDKSVSAVLLGSGRELECTRVIYCDRWAGLSGVEGLPKAIPLMRHRKPVGVLQVAFTHAAPMGVGLVEGFYCGVHKESGEENQRSVLGYFSRDGWRSLWTFFLESDEAEDNHAIAKKVRRMKQTLERMFTGSDWLPEGKADFLSTVVDEQIRFEEAAVFSSGQLPTGPLQIPKAKGIYFLTDGYGPSHALDQVGVLLREEVGLPTPPVEAEGKTEAEAEPPGKTRELLRDTPGTE